MKMERLVGILTILLQRERVTAPELAKRFEVSRRTITRDVEALCKAGVPLVTTQGVGGGISVMEGYKLDKTLLTSDEWQTIFAALQGIDSVSKNAYLASLLEKLSGHGSQIVVDGSIRINLASHYQDSLTPKIETIRQAIAARRLLSFLYYSEAGEHQRVVEPYQLVFQWSSWYLYGFCRERGSFRLFKLGRLWQLVSEPAELIAREIPPLPDVNCFAAAQIHLKALFAVSEKHRLIEEYGIDCFTQTADGLLFEWDYANEPHMREWVFSFGDRVHVLAPESLRIERLRQAQHILEMEYKRDT